jgi:hypothetical protein
MLADKVRAVLTSCQATVGHRSSCMYHIDAENGVDLVILNRWQEAERNLPWSGFVKPMSSRTTPLSSGRSTWRREKLIAVQMFRSSQVVGSSACLDACLTCSQSEDRTLLALAGRTGADSAEDAAIAAAAPSTPRLLVARTGASSCCCG